MQQQATKTDERTTDSEAVRALYQELLSAWNERNAAAFARLFDQDGHVIGFDGSPMSGPTQIAAELGAIFANHQTAAYVGKVRAVRFPSPGVAVLSAVAGMVPPGGTAINPAVNTIQSLVASRQPDRWRIVLYQNTPAQFHGRPEMSAALTEELQALL